MRIVHVCRVAPPRVGGMETFVEGLTAKQAAHGHEVRVVTLRDRVDGPSTYATEAGVPVLALPRIGPRRWPFALGLAPALRGAELIHVHGVDGLADQVLTVRQAGVAVGISTHGAYLHTARQVRVKAAWLRTGTRWSLRRADRVWFTSQADRRRLSPARLDGEVLGNGLDLEAFHASAAAAQREPGRLLVLGRVDRHKGHDRLLDVIAGAVAAGADPSVHVVGPLVDPGWATTLRRKARSLGLAERVHLHGQLQQADVLAHLGRAWSSLHPSRQEGFGLALVECMAAGCVPVAHPIEAFQEHLVDGVNGWWLDFDAPSAGDRLARLLEAPSLSRQAVLASRAYAWETMYARWDRAYEALVAR